MKPFLYDRLYTALLLELAGGHYAVGDRFLSLRGIAERFGSSKSTATSVQERLLLEGLIVTRPRSGTFVAPGSREQAMLILARGTPAEGVMPHTWQNKRERLRLDAGAPRPRHVMVLYSIPHQTDVMQPGHDLRFPSPRAWRGCLEAARQRGVEATLILHNGSELRQQQILEWMTGVDLGGALIAQRTATFRHFHEVVDPLLAMGLPVVHLFGDSQGADLVSVDFNNVAGGFQAGQRMLAAGHRKLTVVRWAHAFPGANMLRMEGLRLAAQQYGAEIEEIPIEAEGECITMPRLFTPQGGPEALVCLSFEFAVELLEQAHGLAEAGRDFSLIAFSSIAQTPEGRQIDIIRMDFDHLGASAMDLLLDAMEGKKTPPALLVPMEVELHGSTIPGDTEAAS